MAFAFSVELKTNLYLRSTYPQFQKGVFGTKQATTMGFMRGTEAQGSV
jgi:hypothetical protein